MYTTSPISSPNLSTFIFRSNHRISATFQPLSTELLFFIAVPIYYLAQQAMWSRALHAAGVRRRAGPIRSKTINLNPSIRAQIRKFASTRASPSLAGSQALGSKSVEFLAPSVQTYLITIHSYIVANNYQKALESALALEVSGLPTTSLDATSTLCDVYSQNHQWDKLVECLRFVNLWGHATRRFGSIRETHPGTAFS